MEQGFQDNVIQTGSNPQDFDKLKSASSVATGPDSNSGEFDCNICLDLVQDPVVTFCGHLYCWPCIYRWLQPQKASEHPNQHPTCPVCKAEVSQNTLIPLYGRGQSGKPFDSSTGQNEQVVPHRPNRSPDCVSHAVLATTSRTPHFHPNQQLHYRGGSYHDYPEMHQYYSLGDYSRSPAFGFAGTTTYQPMIGMFGEMICARFFRNSQTTLYTHPNTYSNVGTITNSGRVRRQVIQAETSLSRVSFFLFCCIILCLLLF